jgi:hypothetical protein
MLRLFAQSRVVCYVVIVTAVPAQDEYNGGFVNEGAKLFVGACGNSDEATASCADEKSIAD